jgi:hypothetical protein
MYISSSLILLVLFALWLHFIDWAVLRALAFLLGLIIVVLILAVGPNELRAPLFVALLVFGLVSGVRDLIIDGKCRRAALRIAASATDPVQFYKTNPHKKFSCPTCSTSYFTVLAAKHSAVCANGHQAWKPFKRWISRGRIHLFQRSVDDYA